MRLGSHLPCFAVVLVLAASSTLAEQVLGPSGEVLIAPTANNLMEVKSPRSAPAPAPSQQVQADCLIETGTFYGSDFLSVQTINASSPNVCCGACRLAKDCTVWNWCGSKEGCPLPPNLATAGSRDTVDYQTCIWKPRPVEYGGTLPLPPTSNNSDAMVNWTSGIPINATLLPALPGFELTPGIEMEYSEEQDFFCTGSSTSKPVCQLYGNAKGGALACLNNPICRGFQICWAFPTGDDYYSQSGLVRLKAGAQVPLNISGSYQNPYCSVYVLKTGTASVPNSGDGGYPLRTPPNVIQAADAAKIQIGRRLSQSGSTIGSGQRPNITILSPTPVGAPAPASGSPSKPLSISSGTNFSTTYLQGVTLQAFTNVTFNYSGCYSDSPTIRVTIQKQQFPPDGALLAYSIHTWTEVPFRNSGDVCCAFQDQNDFFFNLESGVLAKALPMFVATDQSLVTGPALKNYDTKPATVVQPLVYIPPGQINNPAVGMGRQFTFPRSNSSDFVSSLEKLYFSLAQTALGNQFCTKGSPQLAPAVNFIGGLLSELSTDGLETPGGLPVDISLEAVAQKTPDGAAVNASCLVEQGVEYEGDVLQTFQSNSTLESCCLACWQFFNPQIGTGCDLWVLNGTAGSCQLKNSTLAAEFQAVPTRQGAGFSSFVSGRRTAILPQDAPSLFADLG